MPANLTPAELAEGLAKGEAAGWNLRNSESRRSEYLRCWFNEHGEAALRELAALREQLAAEREKRAALVAEFRRRCDERKLPKVVPLGFPSTEAAAWHDAAVLLAALDAEGA